MSTKLTLTLSKEVIEQAKLYASSKGRSLSEMVEAYFKMLTDDTLVKDVRKPSRRLKKLKGALNVDANFDYQKILEEERDKKHG